MLKKAISLGSELRALSQIGSHICTLHCTVDIVWSSDNGLFSPDIAGDIPASKTSFLVSLNHCTKMQVHVCQ